MPAGCTALDFAFQIHTFLGSHCIGAKVNHRLVPLSHKLNSGDQVEILTSNSQHVQPSWINFVSTAKAKGKIQAILRRDNREMQKKGEQTLNDFLARHNMEVTSSVLDKLCDLHEIKKHELLFQAIGDKTVILGDKDIDELLGKKKREDSKKSWRRLIPFLGGKEKAKVVKEAFEVQDYFIVSKDFNRKKPVYITENNITQFIFPNCCNPIPGDDALGFIDNKNHIEIHKRNCQVANRLKSGYGNRILDVKWDMHKRLYFNANIILRGIDRLGLLNDLTQIISHQLNVDMKMLTFKTNENIFDGEINLRVHDRDDVQVIIDELKALRGIQEIHLKT
jgi:GTP pyrophosphokinase